MVDEVALMDHGRCCIVWDVEGVVDVCACDAVCLVFVS